MLLRSSFQYFVQRNFLYFLFNSLYKSELFRPLFSSFDKLAGLIDWLDFVNYILLNLGIKYRITECSEYIKKSRKTRYVGQSLCVRHSKVIHNKKKIKRCRENHYHAEITELRNLSKILLMLTDHSSLIFKQRLDNKRFKNKTKKVLWLLSRALFCFPSFKMHRISSFRPYSGRNVEI